MKFITKLKNRLKKISGIPPNAKPDSDADKSGTDKDSDKTQVPDPKKDDERHNKPKREIDPDKTGKDIDLIRSKTLALSPIVPGKRDTRWYTKH
jgi:hypothetical protein